MTYKDFINSLKYKKIHKVDPSSPNVELDTENASYVLGTSGSQQKKYFIHSLRNIEKSVHSFLKSHPLTAEDRWWVSLSTEHVAGFSILARSYFAGIKAPLEEPFAFDADRMRKEKISVLSLVPTQIFDIVSKNIKASPRLKYVFVGGASLSDDLFENAKDLGWPLIPCFGSTETFAQFASTEDNKTYKPYDGWSLKQDKNNSLLVKGPSIYTHQVFTDGSCKSYKELWLKLSDKAVMKGNTFKFEGRVGDLYKSKGRFYSFKEQKGKFEKIILENKCSLKNSILLVIKEERNGAGLYHITSDVKSAEKLFKGMPELRGSFLVKNVNELQNELGKPLKSKIEDALAKPLLLF